MDPPSLKLVLIFTLFFFIALAIRSVFAFLETSITALRLFKLKECSLRACRYQKLFQILEKTPHRVLITILVASSFADVTVAGLATSIMESLFSYAHLSSKLGFTFGIAIASITLVVFGEILPKNIAKSYGERLFPSMLWLINIIFYLFNPLAKLLTRFSDILLACVGKKHAYEGSTDWISSEKEIRFLIDYVYKKGIIGIEKTEMLQNIFELGRTPIKDIMAPSTDIISIDVKTSLEDVLTIFAKYRFTRLPIYQDKVDNIIGMIHQKDAFEPFLKKEKKVIKNFIRPIMFVPESMKVNQLLREFRQKQMHIAVVLNEYGIITGLTTLKDVLEEIVGEISDEHETITKKIIPLQEGGWVVNARVSLDEIGIFLHSTFKSEDSTTLAERLQHVPQVGEQVIFGGYCFQIQKATLRRVQKVLIFNQRSNNN